MERTTTLALALAYVCVALAWAATGEHTASDVIMASCLAGLAFATGWHAREDRCLDEG